jgi:hypothetical protein
MESCKDDCNCQKCYSKRYYIKNKIKILKYQKIYYYENSNPRKRRDDKKEFEFHKKKTEGFIISFK